jgi:hypothetical protein
MPATNSAGKAGLDTGMAYFCTSCLSGVMVGAHCYDIFCVKSIPADWERRFFCGSRLQRYTLRRWIDIEYCLSDDLENYAIDIEIGSWWQYRREVLAVLVPQGAASFTSKLSGHII